MAGIYYQTFVRNPDYVKNTGVNSATFFQKLSYNGTRYLIKLFKENIHDSTALGVTEALILGTKKICLKSWSNRIHALEPCMCWQFRVCMWPLFF